MRLPNNASSNRLARSSPTAEVKSPTTGRIGTCPRSRSVGLRRALTLGTGRVKAVSPAHHSSRRWSHSRSHLATWGCHSRRAASPVLLSRLFLGCITAKTQGVYCLPPECRTVQQSMSQCRVHPYKWTAPSRAPSPGLAAPAPTVLGPARPGGSRVGRP